MKRGVEEGKVSRIMHHVARIKMKDAIGVVFLVAGGAFIAGGYSTGDASNNEYNQAISAYASGDVAHGNVLKTEADRDANQDNRDVIVGMGLGVAGTIYLAKGSKGKLFK